MRVALAADAWSDRQRMMIRAVWRAFQRLTATKREGCPFPVGPSASTISELFQSGPDYRRDNSSSLGADAYSCPDSLKHVSSCCAKLRFPFCLFGPPLAPLHQSPFLALGGQISESIL